MKNCQLSIVHYTLSIIHYTFAGWPLRNPESTKHGLVPFVRLSVLTRERQQLSLCVLSFSPDSLRLCASALKNKPAALKNNHAALTKIGYVENKANTLIHTKTKECSERLNLFQRGGAETRSF